MFGYTKTLLILVIAGAVIKTLFSFGTPIPDGWVSDMALEGVQVRSNPLGLAILTAVVMFPVCIIADLRAWLRNRPSGRSLHQTLPPRHMSLTGVRGLLSRLWS